MMAEDNGSELNNKTGLTVYFADPYAVRHRLQKKIQTVFFFSAFQKELILV